MSNFLLLPLASLNEEVLFPSADPGFFSVSLMAQLVGDEAGRFRRVS